jgi:hypothetical protein
MGSASLAFPAIDIPASFILQALEVLILLRFGVPAVITAGVVAGYLLDIPITTDFSSWYAAIGLFPIAVSMLIAFYGFRIALAGKPLWREDLA